MRLRPWVGRGRRFFERTLRRVRRTDRRVVTLSPEGEPVGRALFSYVVDPFLLPEGIEPSHSHTHYWESLTIGRTLAAFGFEVDVIHWTNLRFQPATSYDLLLDVRINLERLAPLVGPHCLKLMHIETAHHVFYNAAQERRRRELAERRGIRLAPFKTIAANRAIESADAGTILGNASTQATYAHAGKPLWPIPISQPFLFSFPDGKDYAAARRRFVWFGSGGLLHKGLDRVLEVFASLPELQLTVLGPVEREREFERAFARELYATPNITTRGWIDVASPAFAAIAREHLALVYPSCSEGQNGGAITCMHAGLLPVLSRESGIDLAPDRGVELATSSVEEIRGAVLALAERSPAELEAASLRAWEWVRAHHTRERFAAAYHAAIREILDRFRPDLARRLRS